MDYLQCAAVSNNHCYGEHTHANIVPSAYHTLVETVITPVLYKVSTIHQPGSSSITSSNDSSSSGKSSQQKTDPITHRQSIYNLIAADTFHRCYTSVMSFISTLGHLASECSKNNNNNNTTNSIIWKIPGVVAEQQRWNLGVYYQVSVTSNDIT